MSSFGIDLRKEGTSEKDSQPKEAQSVVVEKKENKNSNFIEWKVGDRCEALYKDDNKYYPAIIHQIDEFQIDVTVFYIGYNSSAVLDMSQIRKPTSRWDTVDHLPEKDIKAGAKCRVIYHGDGNFYDAIIESIVGDTANIRYTKFNTYDSVPKSSLKVAVKATEEQPSDDLRILPTDDKKTVNQKKKKLFLLQRAKEAKEENDFLKSKQTAWQQFQNRTQNKRRTLVAQGVIADPFKKDSIFRTSEGTKRTSGAAPTERSMTPAPKRVNTVFKK
ncbi:hypothetical protein WA171_002089 [Blastocystis sp. BT1]